MNKSLRLLHYVFSLVLSIFFQRVNKSIGLILVLLFLSLSVFAQNGVTRLFTDFNGYWTSSSTAINPVQPNNKNNLLGFTWTSPAPGSIPITYSTGVNDAILAANGVAFTPATFQAFPVRNVTFLPDGTAANLVALGAAEAGPAQYPYTVPVPAADILTRGIRGLDLGSGFTNIPNNLPLTFDFGAITDATQLGDGVPDILITQIASTGGASDQVWFEDNLGNVVGNVVTINMAPLPFAGKWKPVFYNINTGIGNTQYNGEREIRIWAADASYFGITAANYTRPLLLKYKLSGSSDPAFLAFNNKFISIVNANDDVASTNENTPVNINVLANDEPKNGLNVNSMIITQQPTNGTVNINTINGVRLVTYTPNPGFTGVDTFKYQVCNGAATPQCDDAIVTVNVGSSDVQVTKTANTLTPSIGGNVVFTLTAKNNGPNTASNVVVRDVLPAGYTFVSTNPSTGGYDSVTSNWAVGTMANGATASITITARVSATGPYANTATITTSTLDPNENNNASTITPVPVLSTNLAVTKVVDINNPTVGSNVVFTLTAQNIGPSNATGVTVNDLLPSGYTFVSAVPAATTTYNASSGVWNIGSLTSGAAAITLTITAKVNPTGAYANTATISGAQTDPVSTNNTATVTPAPVAQADLAITKTVTPANPDVNANVIFTIGLTNNGPSAANSVVINDVLPTGYTYISSSATAGTYTNADGKWTLGTVNNAATATLTITAKVNATGVYTNTATTSTTTADPTAGNNTASATPTPVPITDLKVTKTAAKDIINNAATVNPGDTETFSIVVTNTGPSAATNVVATDIIPNGYTYSNSTPSVGVYDQTTGKWTIGNLANGASATLTINAIINASGTYSNYVSLTGTEKDLDLSNNEAYAPLANTNADVSIVKVVNNATPNVGAKVIFTLTANNSASSTSDATQVTVTDILPSGYTYVSSSATVGTYNVANGVWYIGNLLKGSTQVLTLVARVNPSGDYLNTTHIVATQSDPVPANNASQALVTPIANADLAIVKTMNNGELNNNKGVFTIVVTNNGPSTATNVIVNDVLPTGYTYTSQSATTGSYTAGVWTIGNLVSGASATLTLNSTLNASGNYVNTATASSATNDLVPANNSSSAQPAPLAPTGNAAQSFCEITDARVSSLVATGNNIKWYASASGGTALSSTTVLVNGAKYYASQTIAGTESVNRFEVTAIITVTPAPTTTSTTQSFCEISAAIINSLQITGTAVKWYDAAVGGTLLTGTTPLVNNAIYYATQTLNGCESKSRTAIRAIITTTASPTGLANQTFCEISSPTIAELGYTATGIVRWYESASSTVVLSANRPLVNGETYYATQTLNGCESLTRFAVTVQIAIVPAPTATTPQSFCTSESAKISNLLASGSNIQWYANATGGSPLAGTTALVNGTTYYASQTVNGCESKSRTPVNVTINVNPTATISGGGTVCDGATLPNVSIALTGNAPWNIIYNNGTSNIAVTGITTSPYIITNAPAGTYTVTSVSNASCAGTSSGSAQVIVNPLPTATVSGGGATCVGSPKSNVSFAFTGTAPFTFTYTDGTTPHTITNTSTNPYILTNAAVGNYSVTAVTDATGCNGTFSGSAQVIENPVPTATISGGGVVCFGVTPPDVVVTLAGTAPFSFNYTIGGVTNSVTNHNSNTFNIVNPAEGTYSVTQLHDANCTGAPASTTVSVVIINVPDVIITHPNCVSNSSGSIRVTSPLDPTIEYSIDNGITWQSNPYFGNLAAGNFTVLARKGACLSNPRPAVLDPAVNEPVISLIQPDCSLATGTITVTSHPGQQYSLNSGAWVATNVFAGLIAGNYTVKVRNAITFCESNVANATINAQPPTPNAPISTSPINYCVGETASVLSATADGTNTLLWYNDATGGVGNTNAPTPSTATAGLQEFYVSQRTAAGCESARTKIEVNINTLPAAPITDGDKETCEAVVMPILTATAPAVAGFNIVWYDAASGGNVVVNPTLNAVGTITYYAAAQNATTSCLSSSRTAVVLTINPTSAAPTSGGDQTVCATSPLQILTATATVTAGHKIVWYDAPAGGSITTPTQNAIGTVTYYAASKNDITNCESLTRTAVVLTINETPSAPIAQNQTECANTPLQTLTATATVQTGQSVVWYDASTAGNVVTNPTLSTSGTVTYFAVAKVDATGCESLTRTPVILTLRSPLTAGTIANNQDLCRTGSGTVQPAAITFSTLPSGGATTYTYVWQSSLDNFTTVFGNNLATTANYTPTPINVTTYYRVLITSGDCGTVTSNIIAVSVKDAPTLTLASNANQSLCNTTSIVNSVYTWGGSATGATATNLPNGLIATQDLVAKTLTISGTPTASGTYIVTTTGIIAPCATQATRSGVITVNALPVAPTNTTVNAVQCATSPTQTITATATAPGGSSVVWYDASTGGNIVTPTLNTVGNKTYYAASKNSLTGCESASRTPVTLTINELPSVPSSGGNQTQCANAVIQTLTATAVAPAGTTTVWYNAASGGNVVNNPTLNTVGSITYYAASQDNVTGCFSLLRTPVTLTINPRSTSGDLTVTPQTICAGQTAVLNAKTSLASPTFRWYASADLSGTPLHIGDDFTTPILSSTTIYYVTVQGDDVCENLPNTALAVTVTVNSLTTAAISGTGAICQGATDPVISFTGANGTAPYTFTYNIDGGTNQTVVSTGNIATLTQSSAIAGTFVYNLISVEDASSTKCSNIQTGSATITVNPTPKGFNDIANLDCLGNLAYNLQANVDNTTSGGNALASAFTWTVSANANVTGAINGNGTSINQTLVNTSNIVQQLVYTITPTATGVGNCAGNNFTLTVNVPVCSSMTISKVADKTSITKAGDVINYTITVKNTGNANQTNVIVNDPLISSSALASPNGDNGNGILEKGETWTYTGSYMVVQSDIDNNGKPNTNSHIIRNTATVTSTEITSAQSATVDVNISIYPAITLVKTGVLSLDGNTITYTFTVKNTGNVTINNLSISDVKITTPIVLASTTLAPNASTTATATYIILQSEKEAGSVTNTATVSGKMPSNTSISDISGSTETNDNPTIVNTGVLAVADNGSVNGFTGGEVVANVLSNDKLNGNPATLANVNLTQVSTTNSNVTLDPLTGKVNVAPNTPAGTYTVEYRIEDKLNPGQFKTASVTVTVDVPAMIAVADTGSANGFTGGEGVANVLANDTYNGNPATLANVNLTQVSTTNANVTLDPLTGKVNVAPNTPAGIYTVEYRIEDKLNPGQFKVASVTVTVTTGTITAVADNGTANGFIGGIAVANILANDTYNGNIPASLSNVNISQLSTSNTNINIDVNTGAVNIAAGTLPGIYTLTYEIVDKLDITKKSNATITVVVPEWITDLSIIKTANKTRVELNENISYTITVKNNGPATILAGKAIGLIENIPAGLDNVTYTANGGTYNVANQTFTVAANVLVGQTVSLVVDGKINAAYTQNSISNSATVNAATGTNDPDAANNTATIATSILKGKITLVKTGTISANGNTIAYNFTISNIGDIALNNITLVDAKLGLNKTLPGTLAVGESMTHTEIYTLTQADKDFGSVTNTASVKSKSPAGNDITDVSGTDASNDNPTVIVINAASGLELTKVANNTVSKVGDVINYTLVVKNTGAVTLSNVVVADAKADAGSISPASIATLLPGASVSVTAKHTLTQTEVDNGSFSNQASVSGKNPQNVTVSDLLSDDPSTTAVDDATVTQIVASPSLLFTKTALNSVSKVGDVINYTLIVRNTGNVTLTNLVVTDAGADVGSISPSTIASLLPGAMVTITAKHTLTQAEVNAGRFSNQANVAAKDPKGNVINKVSDDPNTVIADDATVVTIGSAAAMVLTKTANNTGVKAGDVLNYTLIVKNTGNVTLTNVVVVDAGADAGSILPATIPSILPGATAIVTAKHTLIQTEINSGSFSNQASASGKDPLNNTIADPKSDDPNTPAVDDPTVVVLTPNANIVTVKELKNQNQSSYIPGEDVVYKITVTNNGPSAATNMRVVDNAPVGTSIVKWTATATNLTLPNATGTGNLDQTIPLMQNAAVVVYEVTVKTLATSSLPLSNTVVVTSSTPDLTTAGDNLTTAAIPAEIRNDLSITKMSNHNLASGVNDEFDYVITVKNNGLFTANAVVVTDVLANGITYVSHNVINGSAIYTATDNTLVWTTPTLSAGATITLTLKVKSTISGLISNTATVKASETDPLTDNNSATDLKEIFRLNTKPNVITPNGDGKNDTYVIDGLELYPENYLRIFNRWGNEVFHSNGSYKNDWNGYGLKEGTYYYLLKVKEPNGTMSFSKGFITLLRNN